MIAEFFAPLVVGDFDAHDAIGPRFGHEGVIDVEGLRFLPAPEEGGLGLLAKGLPGEVMVGTDQAQLAQLVLKASELVLLRIVPIETGIRVEVASEDGGPLVNEGFLVSQQDDEVGNVAGLGHDPETE